MTDMGNIWTCLASATLQSCVASYQALLAKCNYKNYTKIGSFIEQLLDSHKDQFKAIINEGQLVAKMSLQSTLDVADTVASQFPRSLL